eukprot:g1863.t1
MVARRPFPPRKRFRLRRLQRLLFGAAPARAGARRTRLAKADSGLTKETTPVAPASPRKDGIEKVQEHVKVQLEKSYKNFQASRGAGDLQQFDARTAVKRVVPRYARINGLAVRRPEGLEGSVPAGKKIYYRDVHLPDVLVFRPMGQSCVDDVNLFDEGALVFQQKASMFPALALEPAPGLNFFLEAELIVPPGSCLHPSWRPGHVPVWRMWASAACYTVQDAMSFASTRMWTKRDAAEAFGQELQSLGDLDLAELTAVAPVDGRYRKNTKGLAEYFSEYGLIRYRVHVEIEYFLALMKKLPVGQDLPASAAESLRSIPQKLTLENAREIKDTEKVTNHDVKAVEYFIKKRFDELGLDKYKEWVHFALTSQEKRRPSSRRRLDRSPIRAFPSASERFQVFIERIEGQLKLLKQVPHSCKFGGATGNMRLDRATLLENAHLVTFPDIDWRSFANEFCTESLGLQRQQYTTQIEHYDNMGAIFDGIKRLNTILLDLCRDVWMPLGRSNSAVPAMLSRWKTNMELEQELTVRITVQQMSGKTTALEVSPDMTIGEFKRELKELQDYEDELMKKMTSVKVIMGETMLVDNDQMIWKAGISPDVILQVCFTVHSVECSRAEELSDEELGRLDEDEDSEEEDADFEDLYVSMEYFKQKIVAGEVGSSAMPHKEC